ncbi:MAG TPA: hypothetical protein VN456_06975, partial [Desulfosporosinus sp.]|nr:hypothetical protein [Desulfosporosinus sp.]
IFPVQKYELRINQLSFCEAIPSSITCLFLELHLFSVLATLGIKVTTSESCRTVMPSIRR